MTVNSLKPEIRLQIYMDSSHLTENILLFYYKEQPVHAVWVKFRRIF
jgi:hypothetical protein